MRLMPRSWLSLSGATALLGRLRAPSWALLNKLADRRMHATEDRVFRRGAAELGSTDGARSGYSPGVYKCRDSPTSGLRVVV